MRELLIVILISSVGASVQAQGIPAYEVDVEGPGDGQPEAPPDPPSFGESLCDLLWQEPVPIGPIRQTSPRPGRSPSPAVPTGVALRDLIITPAPTRLPVALGAGQDDWQRVIRVTVVEDRPLVFAADRAIRLHLTDTHRNRIDLQTFREPESDDRMCNQVRFVALADVEPGEYLATVASNASGTVGLVATHLPAPPPLAPAPPQRTPSVDDNAPGAADERLSQLARGDFERTGDARPMGTATNRSTVIIPCAYDVRFVSFTPRSAPGTDQRGEFEFGFAIGENAQVTYNDFSNSVGVDQTRFVHQALGQVLVPCNDVADVPIHLTGTEVDDWFIFGWVNPNDTADQAESIALDCGGGPTEYVQTYTMAFSGATGTVRHTVDVELAFRQTNQAESCDEYDDPDALSPCTYDVELATLEHVSSPSADKNGDFTVAGNISEGFGLKYPVSESKFVKVKRSETEPLEMHLARYTVPCGETYSIPVRVLAKENDAFADDFGDLTQTIDLSCPPTSPLGNASITYAIDLAQQNGAVKHQVRVAARGRVVADDFCEPEPTIAACVFAVDGYDVTHTAAPSADKKGEFRIESDLGHGNDVQWNTYNVKLGETQSKAIEQGRVAVPCGETIDAPLQILATEEDIIDLWVANLSISMPHEYGGATVPLQFTCPPAAPATAHSTQIELRNARGDRQHDIDLGFEARLDNPTTACFPLQVPAPEPPATVCNLEVDLWKFAHENDSTGDKSGFFNFEFEVNYPGTAHPTGQGESQGWHHIYRGNTKTLAEPIVFPDLGEPGTSHGSYFEIPVGTTVPVSIRIDVTESDVFGDDKGWRETTLNLHCGITAAPQDVVLPIKINDDKHRGTITLRVQEY